MGVGGDNSWGFLPHEKYQIKQTIFLSIIQSRHIKQNKKVLNFNK